MLDLLFDFALLLLFFIYYYFWLPPGCWMEEAATLRLHTPPLRQISQWSFPASFITAEFVTCHNFFTCVCACVCVCVHVCVCGAPEIKCYFTNRLICPISCFWTMPATGTGRTFPTGFLGASHWGSLVGPHRLAETAAVIDQLPESGGIKSEYAHCCGDLHCPAHPARSRWFSFTTSTLVSFVRGGSILEDAPDAGACIYCVCGWHCESLQKMGGQIKKKDSCRLSQWRTEERVEGGRDADWDAACMM